MKKQTINGKEYSIERNANLSYANLHNANLHNANLTDANLRYTDLRYANLRYADLSYANLTDANLTDADLTGANLTDADLTGANLTDADLTGANLTDADLRNAILPYTVLADDRVYALSYRWDGDTLLFYAGCRQYTLKEAVAHWSAMDYPNPKRGQRYLKTCQFLHEMNEAGLLLGGKEVE